MENQKKKFSENEDQDKSIEDNSSLATDGPVSQSEGDGGADLNETDVIPGSEEAVDDIDINPTDDLNTNIESDDLQALEGLDHDENNNIS